MSHERNVAEMAAVASDELKVLARAIAEAAIKVGIIKSGDSLTAAQLIQVCDDLATAAMAASKPEVCKVSENGGAHLLPRSAAISLTESFVQPVPDHCDRVVWRGSYYRLGAHRLETSPRPMETVPRDGTAFRVLVKFTLNSVSEVNPDWTLGIFDYDADTGEGEGLRFVGWDWAECCFTEAQGIAIGWLPLLDVQEMPAS